MTDRPTHPTSDTLCKECFPNGLPLATPVAYRSGHWHRQASGCPNFTATITAEPGPSVPIEEVFAAEKSDRWTGSLCSECGFDVKVDEDGCCVTCGRDAVGAGVESALRYKRAVETHG